MSPCGDDTLPPLLFNPRALSRDSMSETIDKTIEGNKSKSGTSPTSPPPLSPTKPSAHEGENMEEMRSIINVLTADLSAATAHGKRLEEKLNEETGHLRRFKKKVGELKDKLQTVEGEAAELRGRLPLLEEGMARATEYATEILHEIAGLVSPAFKEEYVMPMDEEPTSIEPALTRAREYLVALNMAFDHALEYRDEVQKLQREVEEKTEYFDAKERAANSRAEALQSETDAAERKLKASAQVRCMLRGVTDCRVATQLLSHSSHVPQPHRLTAPRLPPTQTPLAARCCPALASPRRPPLFFQTHGVMEAKHAAIENILKGELVLADEAEYHAAATRRKMTALQNSAEANVEGIDKARRIDKWQVARGTPSPFGTRHALPFEPRPSHPHRDDDALNLALSDLAARRGPRGGLREGRCRHDSKAGAGAEREWWRDGQRESAKGAGAPDGAGDAADGGAPPRRSGFRLGLRDRRRRARHGGRTGTRAA